MNFQIETTSFCNLTCPECPNHRMERRRSNMTLEVFRTIIDRYVVPYKHLNGPSDCPPTVILHKDGEPLLNRHLPEFLGIIAAADPSLKVDIYTHGLLLTREFIDFLGTLPMRMRLLVSFHFNNHDGSVNDYAETTKLLMDVLTGPRERQPANVEFIFASHLVPPMTREKLEAWRDSWRVPIAAGRVAVHANVDINPWTGLIDAGKTTTFTECPYGRKGMYGAWLHIFFGATGNIVSCCMDLEEQIVFGNVMKDEPSAMVEKLTTFYDDVAEKRLDHQLCRFCLGIEKRNP